MSVLLIVVLFVLGAIIAWGLGWIRAALMFGSVRKEGVSNFKFFQIIGALVVGHGLQLWMLVEFIRKVIDWIKA